MIIIAYNIRFRGADSLDYSLIYEKDGDTVVSDVQSLDLDEALDCGQCFRWIRRSDHVWEGISRGQTVKVSQQEETLIFHGVSLELFDSLWRGYFDLDRDYGEIKRIASIDPNMAKAMAFAPGIRVLRQEPWEALCTFILSQNNNIPRIRGLVERLCGQFGQPAGNGFHTFPAPETLAALSLEELTPVRAGFRAKYILDAARKVATGSLDLDAIGKMPLEEARAALRAIHGVGPKVADCALLYGFGKVEAVPVDVWVKRAMAALYPQGFPQAFAGFAGIAQQYVFHYVRGCPEALELVPTL